MNSIVTLGPELEVNRSSNCTVSVFALSVTTPVDERKSLGKNTWDAKRANGHEHWEIHFRLVSKPRASNRPEQVSGRLGL